MLQTDDLKDWPQLYRRGDWLVTGSLTGAAALFKMWENAFGIPPSLASPGYKTNPGWGEFSLSRG